MALKFFFIYVLSFLAGSIAMVAFVKKFAEGFSTEGKKPILFGGLSAVMASGTAFLVSFLEENAYSVFWILTAIFLIIGMIHVSFFHKKYFLPGKNNRTRVIIGEFLFCIALVFFIIVVFSSLEYFLKDKSFPFYPMLLSLLAFFIPISFQYTFEAANNIPEPVFKSWAYPIHNPIDLPDEIPNEHLLVIAFEIAKNRSSDVKTTFRAKGPENMKLGNLYYHFINDYNEFHSETTIDYTDNQHGPDFWWFRIKRKWYQRQNVLNPEWTMRENKIKENSIIICERIESLILKK
ncbi:MAG: TssN family type VI secretion system protein [Ferruginibacter sp.]